MRTFLKYFAAFLGGVVVATVVGGATVTNLMGSRLISTSSYTGSYVLGVMKSDPKESEPDFARDIRGHIFQMKYESFLTRVLSDVAFKETHWAKTHTDHTQWLSMLSTCTHVKLIPDSSLIEVSVDAPGPSSDAKELTGVLVRCYLKDQEDKRINALMDERAAMSRVLARTDAMRRSAWEKFFNVVDNQSSTKPTDQADQVVNQHYIEMYREEMSEWDKRCRMNQNDINDIDNKISLASIGTVSIIAQ